MNEAADPWAVSASTLPLAFAQVREDPLLDLALARDIPSGGTVVMIASGGETAACLGRLPLRLHLVDMNPAQLALSRLKWHLASEGDLESAATILGHRPVVKQERMDALREWFSRFDLPEDAFGPLEFVAEVGPDHAGRYEVAFAELRKHLAPVDDQLEALLRSTTPVPVPDGIGQVMDEAFANVMALPNLVQLFGQEATQNPRRSFSDHFAWRTREAFATMPPASNPFLWQILRGEFPPGHPYDWLRPAAAAGPPMTRDVEWHRGKMADVLDSMPGGSAALVHLSNILDWLSPEESAATLQKARRVLVPGGKVIIRQLNSTLDIPSLESGFRWDVETGRAMEIRDRSYFYPGIHIGIAE